MTEPKTLIDAAEELLNEFHEARMVIREAAGRCIRDPQSGLTPLRVLHQTGQRITNRYAEELASLVVVVPEIHDLESIWSNSRNGGRSGR